MSKLEQLIKFISGKNVAVIGNASSILKTKKDIDNKHEIIIRINKGFPEGKEGCVGFRTDILALSLNLSKEDIDKHYNPKFILWCTPKLEITEEYLKEVVVKYPYKSWEKLFRKLGARPSTGCMVIDFIYPYCKSIKLYGFDFWETLSWYRNSVHLGQHNPEAERKYIENLFCKQYPKCSRR